MLLILNNLRQEVVEEVGRPKKNKNFELIILKKKNNKIIDLITSSLSFMCPFLFEPQLIPSGIGLCRLLLSSIPFGLPRRELRSGLGCCIGTSVKLEKYF